MNGNIFSQPRLQRMSFLLATVALIGLSGCTQKADIRQTDLVSEPVLDQQATADDFGFPPRPPSLMEGKRAYDKTCMACHSISYWQNDHVKKDLAYTTPIDLFILMTRGEPADVVMATSQRRQVLPKNHPAFRDKLSRDDRWAVIMFTRYLAGAGDIQTPNKDISLKNIFGGNCAVCHGTRGQGDGPLYIGNPSMGHQVHMAPIKDAFEPPPANFTEYRRVYNRTDAQLFKYVCEGIYPSAMPSWYGNVDHDTATGKVTYVFDDFLIWNLVRHVRTFTYTDDLGDKQNLDEVKAAGLDPGKPPAGLVKLDACPSVPTNHPWNAWVRQYGPKAQEEASSASPSDGGHVAP